MDEVKDNPWSEICWYMTESREQYRLNGKLYIIKSDEEDQELKKVCCIFQSFSTEHCTFSRCQQAALDWQ